MENSSIIQGAIQAGYPIDIAGERGYRFSMFWPKFSIKATSTPLVESFCVATHLVGGVKAAQSMTYLEFWKKYEEVVFHRLRNQSVDGFQAINGSENELYQLGQLALFEAKGAASPKAPALIQ